MRIEKDDAYKVLSTVPEASVNHYFNIMREADRNSRQNKSNTRMLDMSDIHVNATEKAKSERSS